MHSEMISAKNYNKVFIYGAGLIGGLLYKFLIKNDVSSEKICFVVSKAADGFERYGRPVFSIDDISVDDGLVFLAADPKYHADILKSLEKKGSNFEIVIINQNLRHQIERQYMKEKSLSPNGEDIDVLLMSSDNYPASGAFLCAAELCEHMNAMGVRMVMILPHYGEGEDILEERSIPYAYVPSPEWLRKNGEDITEFSIPDDAVEELTSIIKGRNIKLVHNNTTYAYVGAIAARECGVPYVWHIRETITDQGKEFINPDYAIDLINGSERILCVSDFIKNRHPHFDKNKCAVVYDGIIEKSFKTENKLTNDSITIINVGVVMPMKGQEDIVNAASILKKRELPFKIIFLGESNPSYRNMLNDVIDRNDLGDCVSFLGIKKNTEYYYDKADIAVISSRVEPFGRCTAEALQAGCLTIGARGGATPELIKDGYNGYLYEIGNAEQLADIIERAINDKERSLEIMKNAAHDSRKFSTENNALQIKKIYEEILNEK